jgi:hypothetical protein
VSVAFVQGIKDWESIIECRGKNLWWDAIESGMRQTSSKCESSCRLAKSNWSGSAADASLLKRLRISTMLPSESKHVRNCQMPLSKFASALMSLSFLDSGIGNARRLLIRKSSRHSRETSVMCISSRSFRSIEIEGTKYPRSGLSVFAGMF